MRVEQAEIDRNNLGANNGTEKAQELWNDMLVFAELYYGRDTVDNNRAVIK